MVPAAIHAHFRLIEPASWLVANDRGDPQKAAPAAATRRTWALRSNIVGKAVGGQKLHLKVQETIYHPATPGRPRGELARRASARSGTTTRTTEKGPYSVWAVIQSPPQIPVIADGLFPHYTRPAQPQIFEADIAAAEHQLQEVHAADCSVDERSMPTTTRWLHVSSLRGPRDHRRPGEADDKAGRRAADQDSSRRARARCPNR